MTNEKRLIDANEIVKVAEHAHEQWSLAMVGADDTRKVNEVFKKQYLCKVVKAVAGNVPTVDAVEVCRCNDCKKWHYIENFKGLCGEFKHSTLGNHFCSYGERKDGR